MVDWGRVLSRVYFVVLCTAFVGLFGPACVARNSATSDWAPIVVARGFTEADVAQLRRDGILITDETYKQVFSAYIGGAIPPFVTSDSLLNAYHVLYEESIYHLEQANARRLPGILRFILANLDEAGKQVQADPQMLSAAKKRAAIIIGTALRLLDPAYKAADESIQSTVEQEVVRVVAAKDEMKPAWLGPAEPSFVALDYNRYKVRGFYLRTEALARYFRAVAWLQSIPFRVAQDEELLSILVLGRCVTRDRFGADDAKYRQYRDHFCAYRVFIGTGDDWDLVAASELLRGDADSGVEAIRQRLLKYASTDSRNAQINDQVRFAPDDPKVTAEPNFRILSAYRTPDGVLFQRTTDRRRFKQRNMPSGLEVCTALGSTFARDKIEDPEKPEVLKTIEQNKPLFKGDSLYADYLHAVAALLDAPDAKAPPFMKGPAWQAKSCGAVLAGWAQLRHTWILQAKPVAFYAARAQSPKGFVEPEPVFYGRLARLATRTRETLDVVHAIDTDSSDTMKLDVGRLWHLLEQTSRRLETIARKQLNGVALDEDDGNFLLKYGETLAALMLYRGNSYLEPEDDAPRVADVYWHYVLGSLHVGIGRARAIYVLYPWQGKDVLCKGAVLPYYEFVNKGRLTDSEWKGILDSDDYPAVPTWLRPITCEKGLRTPDFERRRPPGR